MDFKTIFHFPEGLARTTTVSGSREQGQYLKISPPLLPPCSRNHQIPTERLLTRRNHLPHLPRYGSAKTRVRIKRTWALRFHHCKTMNRPITTCTLNRAIKVCSRWTLHGEPADVNRVRQEIDYNEKNWKPFSNQLPSKNITMALMCSINSRKRPRVMRLTTEM